MGTLNTLVKLVFGSVLLGAMSFTASAQTGLPADGTPQCCNPLKEPGQFGNPACFEGASCCATGDWRCNNAMGQPTCGFSGLGQVCDACCNPEAEPGFPGNPHCFEGATCCASGEWQCNDAGGQSTCGVDGIVCDACCDPDEKPGVGGSPPCFEGASCCSDGKWQCNGAQGNSTCPLDGAVCESPCCSPFEEPGQFGNPACFEGATCCDSGEWACNDATGAPTCTPGERCDICGGFAGIPCDDPKEFCKTSPGECCCDFQGVCTLIPDACPENYDPVCGCDGVTYSNECHADAAGVSVDHVGPCGQVCGGIAGIPCDDGEFCLLPPGGCCCDFQGVCVTPPEQCTNECEPVCGCDGRTYRNRCLALEAGMSIDHDGPCHAGPNLISGLGFESEPEMEWQPQSTALHYNVYRAELDADGSYNAGTCYAAGLAEPVVSVTEAPNPGDLWLFQVSGQFPDGEGPLGIGWTCLPLEPAESCSSSE